jgi:starch synthase
MNILLASAEVHPYSKTGGLADMVAALGKFLAQAGHRVGLVTPLYRGIRGRFPELRPFKLPLALPLGAQTVSARLWTLAPVPGLTVYFVDQPGFFDRAGLYAENKAEYPDNADRFIFLAKCVAHLARHLDWRPELVHVHDWHVALVPLLIRHQGWHDAWANPPKTCLTIHNLAYQGIYPAAQYGLTNLPWYYYHPDGAEYYGRFNLLKTGIAFADALTTVSPRYASEITTPEFGCGLDGLLRTRRGALTGILNGVDYDEWRTAGNPHLPHAYTADEVAGKAANKAALQRELGLAERADVPLFGTITRLEEQKGVDLLLGALEEMLPHRLQYALLGSGQPPFEAAFQQLAARHPGQVAVRIGYDGALAHRIEAACDFYLMPSRFEPSGLNQMYSLRYGTVPVVRATGGLDDAVVDVRENLAAANGIKFAGASTQALVQGIRKALTLYGSPEWLQYYRANGMRTDFSWERAVAEYETLYRRLLGASAK